MDFHEVVQPVLIVPIIIPVPEQSAVGGGVELMMDEEFLAKRASVSTG